MTRIVRKNGEKDEGRECAGCGITDEKSALYLVIMPPLIRERQYLCAQCVRSAVNSSKSKSLDKK